MSGKLEHQLLKARLQLACLVLVLFRPLQSMDVFSAPQFIYLTQCIFIFSAIQQNFWQFKWYLLSQ